MNQVIEGQVLHGHLFGKFQRVMGAGVLGGLQCIGQRPLALALSLCAVLLCPTPGAAEGEVRLALLPVVVHSSEDPAYLREGLAELPESVSLAEQAYENLGRSCTKTIVRGGTDGSRLTEKGLPTPNLSSGQHNIHSVTEYACLDEMIEAVEHLVELVTLWGEIRS